MADLFVEFFAQEAEGDGGFCRCSALRDDDDAEFLSVEIVEKFCEIVFADILAGEEHFRGADAARLKRAERAREGFDDGFGAQIAAADADGYDDFAEVAETACCGVDVVDERIGGVGGELDPSEEVVSGAVAAEKRCDGLLCLGEHGGLALGADSVGYVDFYCLHNNKGG